MIHLFNRAELLLTYDLNRLNLEPTTAIPTVSRMSIAANRTAAVAKNAILPFFMRYPDIIR